MFYKMYRDVMVYAGGGRALQMRRSRIWLRFAKQSEGQNASRSVQGSPPPHVNWHFAATLYNHGIQIDGRKSNILIASAEQTKRSRQNFVATLFQLSTLNSFSMSSALSNSKGVIPISSSPSRFVLLSSII